jgi:hypothetical protein
MLSSPLLTHQGHTKQHTHTHIYINLDRKHWRVCMRVGPQLLAHFVAILGNSFNHADLLLKKPNLSPLASELSSGRPHATPAFPMQGALALAYCSSFPLLSFPLLSFARLLAR